MGKKCARLDRPYRGLPDGAWRNVPEPAIIPGGGANWLRTQFNIPSEKIERAFTVLVRYTDTVLDVWLNGLKTDSISLGDAVGKNYFYLKHTGRLRPGNNELAVRCFRSDGRPGSILMDIFFDGKIMAMSGESCREYEFPALLQTQIYP